MNLQIAVELILAAGAALLLARDVRRAWRDPLRRPVTLLMASLVAVLLIGVNAVGLLLAALGLGMEQSTTATVLVATAGAMGLAAVGLIRTVESPRTQTLACRRCGPLRAPSGSTSEGMI